MEHRGSLPPIRNDLDIYNDVKQLTLQILEYFKNNGDQGTTEILKWAKDFDVEPWFWKTKLAIPPDAIKMIEFIRQDPKYNDFRKNVEKRQDTGYKATSTISGANDVSHINVLEADSYLFDTEDEALAVFGLDSNVKCLDCKSTLCCEDKPRIRYTTVPNAIAKVFTLLELRKLTFSSILVLGSGNGGVAYSCYLFSKKSHIFSCDWEEAFVSLQGKVIERHGMQARQTSISDNTNVSQEMCGISLIKCVYPDGLTSMDLIIICDRLKEASFPDRLQMWKSFKKTLRSGAIIITVYPIAMLMCEFPAKFGQDNNIKMSVEIPNEFKDWIVLDSLLGESIFEESMFTYHRIYRIC